MSGKGRSVYGKPALRLEIKKEGSYSAAAGIAES
jgi:hypothetical protein